MMASVLVFTVEGSCISSLVPSTRMGNFSVIITFIWARIAAVFANKATPKTLNRATGIVLVALGAVVMIFSLTK